MLNLICPMKFSAYVQRRCEVVTPAPTSTEPTTIKKLTNTPASSTQTTKRRATTKSSTASMNRNEIEMESTIDPTTEARLRMDPSFAGVALIVICVITIPAIIVAVIYIVHHERKNSSNMPEPGRAESLTTSD